MLKRLLLVLVLAGLPLTALADDTPAPDSTPDQTATDSPAPSATPTPAQDAVGAGALGPQTNSGTNAGSSTGASSSLQPAGTSPLQSTTNDSGGLTAPASQVLQAPATSDAQLKVLIGEGEGTQSTHDSSTTDKWTWAWFSVVFALFAAGLYVWLRRRPKLLKRIQLRPRHRRAD